MSKAAQKVGTQVGKAFSGIGKTVSTALLAPLRLAGAAARQAWQLFQSLFGAQIKAGFQQMGSSILSAVLSMRQMQTAAGHLREGFSQMISPLVQAVTPALAALTNGLATVLAYAGRLFSFLTGKSVKSADAAAEAVSGVGSAAKGTAKATEQAARSLAGFDEIERLDAPKGSGGGGGGSGGGGAAAAELPAPFAAKSPFLDQLLAAIQAGDYTQLGTLLAQKLKSVLSGIPWPDIQEKAVQWAHHLTDTLNAILHDPGMWVALGVTLGAGLNTALLFLSTTFQTFDWAAFGARLADALDAAMGAIDWAQAGQGISALVRGLLAALISFSQQTDWQAVGSSIGIMLANIDWSGILADVGTAIGAALNALFDINTPLAFIALLVGGFAALVPAITNIIALAVSLLSLFSPLGAIILGVAAAIAAVIAVIALLATHVEEIGAFFQNAWLLIQQTWGSLCAWFEETVILPLTALFTGLTETAGAAFQLVYDKATGLFSDLAGWFSTNVTEPLQLLWQNFSTAVAGVWDGLRIKIKGAVNGIIGFLNRLLSGAADMVNGLVDILNRFSIDVPADVPLIGGTTFGFSLGHVTAPQIPALAQGAVLPPNREFLAVLGDQRHGTNIEAPLETIQQAVRVELQSQIDAMMAGFEAVVAAIRDKDLAVSIGDENIGRAADRWQQRMRFIEGSAY